MKQGTLCALWNVALELDRLVEGMRKKNIVLVPRYCLHHVCVLVCLFFASPLLECANTSLLVQIILWMDCNVEIC